MKNIRFISSLAFYSTSLLLLISSCTPAEVAEHKAEEPIMAPKMETFAVTKDKLTTTLSVPGELVANQEVDIYAKVNSFVKVLKVDIGSEVKAGEVLMILEAPEISSQLAAARSKIKSLEATYIATKASYDRVAEASKTEGAVAQDALDQITARKNSDLAQLEAAKSSLEEVKVMAGYLELRAPFSGVITARHVDVGAYVGPSGKGSALPLVTLQEHKNLRLIVSVPEAHLPYLNATNPVSFTVRSQPQASYSGVIKRQAGALDAKLRSERIELDIPNPDRALLPRMVADVKIPLSLKDSTFVVPETALVDSDEGIYVLKVVSGKVTRLPVRRGRKFDGKVEVFGEMKTGDSLISKATPQIEEGAVVMN